MVSQFVSSHPVNLLTSINFSFPEGTHAIGRLDNHSEGLLLLTTNKKITKLLFESNLKHVRKYLLQVKNIMDSKAVLSLQEGVIIKIKGGQEYVTQKCEVNIVDTPINLFSSGLVLHEKMANTWLEIGLREGKYHQVRKMVSAVGHKCIRLIRISIEELTLGNLLPGEVKEISENDFFNLLHLSP